jgi:hypothetical protein
MTMTPAESLQYLSQVGASFAHALPPPAQGPTVMAINQALSVLQPLVEEAMARPSPGEPLDKNSRNLGAPISRGS